MTNRAESRNSRINSARDLPAVEELLSDASICAQDGSLPTAIVAETIRQALSTFRAQLRKKSKSALFTRKEIIADVISRLTIVKRGRPMRVVNAAGVLAHTNLGRAPLGRDFLDSIETLISGYSNLEYDLTDGERGVRGQSVERGLATLCGSEGAIIVNNCAAALALIINTFSKRKETIVSRGELVQIGGGFRVPDILRAAGATLVEVGTTNITNLKDYRSAISPKSGLLLKVHQSNFAQVGFTKHISVQELAKIAVENEIPLAYDLGSGLVLNPRDVGLPGEMSAQGSLRAGADLVCFSGDKLLGASQAGCIVGRADLIAQLRKNPLYRAYRVDKITLALLDHALRAYLDGTWRTKIPFWTLALRTEAELYQRGRAIIEHVGSGGMLALEAVSARYGGGALPTAALPSCAISFVCDTPAKELAKFFRDLPTPVIGRIEGERFLLDLKAIQPEDEPALIDAIEQALTFVRDSAQQTASRTATRRK